MKIYIIELTNYRQYLNDQKIEFLDFRLFLNQSRMAALMRSDSSTRVGVEYYLEFGEFDLGIGTKIIRARTQERNRICFSSRGCELWLNTDRTKEGELGISST